MKKVLAVVIAAVLFGGVAGATVMWISNLGISNRTAEVQTEVQTEESESTEGSLIEKSSAAEEDDAVSSGDNGVAVLDVSGIVEDTMPQVVSITNTMLIEQQGYSSLFDYFYGNAETREYEVPASGSGVILAKTDDELLILTNNHVVEDTEELTITFVDGESVDANLKGNDSSLDIAVIAVPLENIPESTLDAIEVAKFHDEEDLKVGQGVIAIGNALGYGQTVTVGYISALGREINAEGTVYSDLIQTDAAINPGNSGGALINMDGEVIGINVAKLSNTQVEGFGYSIPIYKVMEAIENLSTAKTKLELADEDRGRMGVYMNTISEQNAQALGIPAGVIIKGFSDEYTYGYTLDSVQPSPARAAGLLKNDIITKFDGQTVTSADELSALVAYYEKGSTVTVTYERLENGSYVEHTTEVTLGALDDPVIEPVNKDEVPPEAYREAEEKKNSGAGAENEGNGSLSPLSPEENAGNGNNGGAEGNGTEDNGAQDDGSNGEDNSGSDTGNSDEVYDLFREFLEQYH